MTAYWCILDWDRPWLWRWGCFYTSLLWFHIVHQLPYICLWWDGTWLTLPYRSHEIYLLVVALLAPGYFQTVSSSWKTSLVPWYIWPWILHDYFDHRLYDCLFFCQFYLFSHLVHLHHPPTYLSFIFILYLSYLYLLIIVSMVAFLLLPVLSFFSSWASPTLPSSSDLNIFYLYIYLIFIFWISSF